MDNLPEMETNPERLAEKALDFYANALESASTTFAQHDTLKREAQVVGIASDTLRDLTEGKEITSTEMLRRTIRPQDNIEPGEHPGARIRIQYADGMTVNINMYGGMGRERTEADDRDHDVSLTTGHAQRTDSILDKKSSMGVVVNDQNGHVIFNSWITHTPGRSVAIAPFSFTNPESGATTHTSVQEGATNEWLNINADSRHPQTATTEKYLYGQLSSTYKELQRSMAHATPKPKNN